MPSALSLHRYLDPTTWAGYLEPRDRSWILFVDADGHCKFFLVRGRDGDVSPVSAPAGEVLQ